MSTMACCCDCRTTTYTFLLCGLPVKLTPVTFTKGAETVSGTTNARGQVTVTFPDDGTWTYTVGVTSGTEPDYTGLTGTVSVTCGLRNAQTISIGCNFPKVLTYAGRVGQAASAFYFTNSSLASPEATPYTLTYQPVPAAIPKDLQLLFFSAPGGVHDPWYVTLPDEAWFSDPIPSTCFGDPVDVYFYAWRSGCNLNVMVIDAPYTTGSTPGATRGAGNNVFSYALTSCVPFQLKLGGSGAAVVTGTHGADDVTATGAGAYTNGRVGLTYAVVMAVLNSSGVGVTGGPVGSDLTAHLNFTTAEGGGAYTPPSSSWSSSNTSVFTVSPVAGTGTAKVHPVAAGSATLSVTVTDPDCTTTTLSATLTIT